MEKPKSNVTVGIRHLVDDPRLRRRFQIHVIHAHRGKLSNQELKEEIAKKFNVVNHQTIFVFGFRTYGHRSSGFGVVYDKLEDALKYEPTRRLDKNGLHGVENKSLKDSKLRCKKIRGVKNRKK